MNAVENWRIAGTYYETCNCQAICPCRRVNGKPGRRSTFRECQFILSWRIETGFAEGVVLGGRSIAMAGFYDNEVSGAPWTVALYIDEDASEPAFRALSDIFLGKAGGTIRFTANIFEVVGVRRAQIILDYIKNRERIWIRDLASAEVERIVSDDGSVTCSIPGHEHPGVESVSRSEVTDPPLMWSYEGRCGFATTFDYHS